MNLGHVASVKDERRQSSAEIPAISGVRPNPDGAERAELRQGTSQTSYPDPPVSQLATILMHQDFAQTDRPGLSSFRREANP